MEKSREISDFRRGLIISVRNIINLILSVLPLQYISVNMLCCLLTLDINMEICRVVAAIRICSRAVVISTVFRGDMGDAVDLVRYHQ